MDVLAAIISGTVVAVVAQWLGYWLMGKRAYHDLVRTKRLERLYEVYDSATHLRDLAIIHKEEAKDDLRRYDEEHNWLRSVEAAMENRYVGMGSLIKTFIEAANGFHHGLVGSVGTGFPRFAEARREMDEAYDRLRARIDDIVDNGQV